MHALGWIISSASLEFSPYRRHVWTRDDDLGKLLCEQFRLSKVCILAERRPRVFTGLTDVDRKKHRALLASLSLSP